MEDKYTSVTLPRDCKELGLDEMLYREKAILIWGSIPYDIKWAINTLVYKNYLNTTIL